jgi:predicted enzyme related to lactoylglutathione lyase
VNETFISLIAADMERALAFYTEALGATEGWSSPRWSSVFVAGVRIGFFLNPEHTGLQTGLHFGVNDLETAIAGVIRAGGKLVTPAGEVAPDVFVAEVADTEGNVFALRRA